MKNLENKMDEQPARINPLEIASQETKEYVYACLADFFLKFEECWYRLHITDDPNHITAAHDDLQTAWQEAVCRIDSAIQKDPELNKAFGLDTPKVH